ncbi:MAG TPA: GyrI-like domain-containing protein [Bradyrhizobium sp.]|nr:GyrI-like domain-containing protein [Bradyrhizobium sp.]
MHLSRAFRLILAGMIAATVPIGATLAQSPAPSASPTATPSAAPSPAPSPTSEASPVPAPSASPTSSASPSPTPSSPPAAAQTPATPPPAAAQTADPFGEPITLEPKKVVTVKGNANWDSAFETLIDSFKALTALLDKQGVKATGNALIVYTATDDTGFTFIAEIPVGQDVKNLGKNMSMGQSPEGKSLKFVHRGSYDNMDNTYEAITNHLDEKRLEAKDLFIEEYITDPLKTAEDKLVINVYVPLK